MLSILAVNCSVSTILLCLIMIACIYKNRDKIYNQQILNLVLKH